MQVPMPSPIPRNIDRIEIFRFNDAPLDWRELSDNGGDEDWLAVIPAGWDIPMFLEEGTYFGVFDVQKISLPAGGTVLIGSHS